MAQFHPGDYVVFRITKFSTEPGPRAQDVRPAPYGETYNYYVDKYWTVRSVSPDGTLQLVTRRGKQHQVAMNDPRLRHATLFEKWFKADRFPTKDTFSQVSQNGMNTPDTTRVAQISGGMR